MTVVVTAKDAWGETTMPVSLPTVSQNSNTQRKSKRCWGGVWGLTYPQNKSAGNGKFNEAPIRNRVIQYLRLNSTLEAMDNRRNDPEEHRNDLEERIMELTQPEQWAER